MHTHKEQQEIAKRDRWDVLISFLAGLLGAGIIVGFLLLAGWY